MLASNSFGVSTLLQFLFLKSCLLSYIL